MDDRLKSCFAILLPVYHYIGQAFQGGELNFQLTSFQF